MSERALKLVALLPLLIVFTVIIFADVSVPVGVLALVGAAALGYGLVLVARRA
jgi:hypothetical protein